MPDLLTLPVPALAPAPASSGADLSRFPDFCAKMTITSKELGLVRLKLWRPQVYVHQEMEAGIADGKRIFYILKYRQAGITTEMLALDLFWPMRHPGTQGQVIFDTDSNRLEKHETLSEMLASLPASWKVPVKRDNREILSFENRSRIMFQSAGVKAVPGRGTAIGQGRGLNYIHATEVSSWADEVAVQRLTSSLAEHHPARLYVFESTARGFDIWYDLWEDAANAVSIKRIFIGWWMQPLYRVERTSAAYKAYWNGRLTGQERIWSKVVKARYGVDLEPEQLAWWRYILAERKQGKENVMLEEYPTLPEDAFQATGSQFIDAGALTTMAQNAKQAADPSYWSYTFGATYDDPSTQLFPARKHDSELTVWEEPVDGSYYAIGADPAYGTSIESDNYCISGWRLDGLKLMQAFEYVTPLVTGKNFAWVLMHLAGSYREAADVLELSGPGMHVWEEMLWMLQYGWGFRGAPGGNLMNILGAVQHYLWKRQDSMLTMQSSYHYKTSGERKFQLMTQLQSYVASGAIVPRSLALIEELRRLRQDGPDVRAPGHQKDDRAIACALAVEAWLKVLVPQMQLPSPAEPPRPTSVLGEMLQGFMGKLGRRLGED